jgi:HPt (histidine-containing phosphotransfer) domain-containing protein
MSESLGPSAKSGTLSPRPHVDLSFFSVLAVLDGLSAKEPLSRLLTEKKIHHKIVGSHDEALQVLDGERFDLLLVEWPANCDSGLKMVQSIRSAEGSYRNIPVLAYAQDGADVGQIVSSSVQDVFLQKAGFSVLEEKLQEWADKIFEALPVLAESSIDKIRMFDDEEHSLLNSLYQIYSESTGAEIVEMEDLVKAQDFALLRKKAHKLKSSAAQLGAFRFEKYCNLLEHDPSLSQDRAQKLYQEMSTEYANSLQEFHRYCQKHTVV